MEEITASATAFCTGVQQELACTGDDGEVACCGPFLSTHICFPPSLARARHWITHRREGVGMFAQVCVFGRTQRGETETWWELGPSFPPGVVVRFSPHQCGMGSSSLTTRVPFIKRQEKKERGARARGGVLLCHIHLSSPISSLQQQPQTFIEEEILRSRDGHASLPSCLLLCRRLFFPMSGCISK